MAVGTAGRRVPLLVWAAALIPVVATVATYGELTLQSFVAVVLAGGVLLVAALHRRSGSGSARVGRRGLVWIGWLVAVALWELLTLLDTPLATLSDLTDPVLVHPWLRGAATVGWALAGWWLYWRPVAPREGAP